MLRQLKMTPYALPVVHFWTSPVILKGPNKSTAVQFRAGAGLSLSWGNHPISCMVVFLSSFLQVTQLYVIDFTILGSPMTQNLVLTLLVIADTP